MKDTEAQDRHLDGTEMFRELQDAYNVACQYLLENSPHSDELFADWSEEDKEELRNYSSEIVEISNQIDALQVAYNELDDTDYTYDEQVGILYRQIVVLNNQLAAKNGKNGIIISGNIEIVKIMILLIMA